VKAPKLVANPKIEKAAREWGMPVNDYLLKLEANGMKQSDIDELSTPAPERQRSSVFNRPTAR